MILKPQDLLITLKLVAAGPDRGWRFHELALQLNMSVSETHAGAGRARRAGLLHALDDGFRVNVRALEMFLLHGVRHVFVPEHGEMTRGLTTGHAAAPMADHFVVGDEPPPVWPTPDGTTRGMAFSPLYKSAPQAALLDTQLYELLVIVDSLRSGRARERKIAEKELATRLARYAG